MEENLFRSIPRVDELLGRDELKVSALPPVLLRESVREELDALRDEVRGGLSALPETGILCARILARAEEKQLPTLRSNTMWKTAAAARAISTWRRFCAA